MSMPPTPPRTNISEDWKTKAACKEIKDPSIFFPPEPITSPRVWDAAREFCKQCEVKLACLKYAIEHEKRGFRPYGMYGGMTPKERDAYSAKP